MILYHGSKEIVEFPEIRTARYNKDFYFGFYCTQMPGQAVRWATRYGTRGYLNKYEYTENSKLKYLVFEKMTEEWLDAVCTKVWIDSGKILIKGRIALAADLYPSEMSCSVCCRC